LRHYNLLFRWFVGLGIDDAVWSPTTFSKNRDRLLTGNDGTLLEAWASPFEVLRRRHRRRKPSAS
jgi:hypothetical protein